MLFRRSALRFKHREAMGVPGEQRSEHATARRHGSEQDRRDNAPANRRCDFASDRSAQSFGHRRRVAAD
jgi:hypothetical protein